MSNTARWLICVGLRFSLVLLVLAGFVGKSAQLVWATTLGGYIRYDNFPLHTVVSDSASGIAVDSAGNAYVVGTMVSSSIRVPPSGIPLVHAFQDSCESNHCVFVTKFAPDGKTILYSTFVGAPASPFGFPLSDGKALIPCAIVADADGNVYLTGAASRLPRAGGGTAQSAGGMDVFVVKIDPTGVLKASMLIGGRGDDEGDSISLGPDGYLYIAGTTQSSDFPVSSNAYKTTVAGPTRFFSLKIDPRTLAGDAQFSSAVVYCTIFGAYSRSNSNLGSVYPTPHIGADSQGNAYASAYTDCTGFEVSPGALRTNCQASALGSVGVIVKINPLGTKLVWVAMPTGSGRSYINGMAVSPQGLAYLAGTTSSVDFPVTPGAFDTTPIPDDGYKSFVAKLNPDGTAPAYATYLGGVGSAVAGTPTGSSGSSITGVAIDSGGSAYVTGATSSEQFPLLNSIQSAFGCCAPYVKAGFVSVFKPDGSGLVSSSLLGVGLGLSAAGIALDSTGNVYAVGYGLDPSHRATTFNSGSTITVIKVAQGGAPFPIDGIANAASFQPGLPMSGGLATMFVRGLSLSGAVAAPGTPLPLELAGVSIAVNGVPAPILSVSSVGASGPTGSQQINFQVPFEVNVGTFALIFGVSQAAHTSVELHYQGVSSFALPTTTPPGIFVLPDGSGAVQHGLDYSLVTPRNPAAPGEVVVVYVTGLGHAQPAPATGAGSTVPAPVYGYCHTPPTVNVGDVLYAGLTPGFPGLYQMNIRLHSKLSSPAQLYAIWTDCESTGNTTVPSRDVVSTSNSIQLPVQ